MFEAKTGSLFILFVFFDPRGTQKALVATVLRAKLFDIWIQRPIVDGVPTRGNIGFLVAPVALFGDIESKYRKLPSSRSLSCRLSTDFPNWFKDV